jgi:hypothetical protein
MAKKPSRHDWSAEELEAQERFRQCQASGGHEDSGREVTRDRVGVLTTFKVCGKCGVPYTKHHPKKRQSRSFSDMRE